jgi:subtilisin family serine protease
MNRQFLLFAGVICALSVSSPMFDTGVFGARADIIEDLAEEAAGLAEDVAEEAAELATEAAEEAADIAADAAEEAAELATEAAEEAADIAADAAEEAAEEAEAATESRKSDDSDAIYPNLGQSSSIRKLESTGARTKSKLTRAKSTTDKIVERSEIFVSAFDRQGEEFVLNEWVVLVEAKMTDFLAERGYQIVEVDELDGLDLVIARVRALDGLNIEDEILQSGLQHEEIIMDLNHVYSPRAAASSPLQQGIMPKALREYASLGSGENLTIGLIDTAIETDHPVFESAQITSRDFVSFDHPRPTAHGTAVASILVGKSRTFSGLLPRAHLYSASVFFDKPDSGQAATMVDLVRALDWMVTAEVPVVNMSFTGPYNKVLETAIGAATQAGTIVVAAVGNNGPTAKPRYPAAIEAAIAVTAVDRSGKIYRLANRGPHIDFSAPGVAILAAHKGGTYRQQSGTSLAVPFAVAVLAEGASVCCNNQMSDRIIKFKRSAGDLGPKGFDPIYGYGLIKPMGRRKDF